MSERLSMKKVTSLLDNSYELVYIDYRDNLDERMQEIQEAIQKQDWQPIDEVVYENDWYYDAQWESIDYILKELARDITRSYDVSDEKAMQFIDLHKEDLEQILYDRDKSTPIDDLLRNTEDPVTFYDTGAEIDPAWYNDGMWDQFNEGIYERTLPLIKSVLAIQDDKYDKDLLLMLQQASYGGRLVIYFQGDIKEMMDLSDKNAIRFKNPAVAIIDTYNGSGDHTFLPGHEFTLPLNVENIFIDKTIKYSYTYEVCGMYSNWCDCTGVSFLKVDNVEVITRSNLHAELEVEAEYIKAYKAGGCTFGDMDHNRHRDIYYLNEYPCGDHCPHCGTFWID